MFNILFSGYECVIKFLHKDDITEPWKECQKADVICLKDAEVLCQGQLPCL